MKKPAAKKKAAARKGAAPKPARATRLVLPLNAAGRALKADVLRYWEALSAGQTLTPRAIAHGTTGSRIFHDTIRLTGSQAWIGQVLSCLHGLRRFERMGTRLEVAYEQVTDRESGQKADAYRCAISVKETTAGARTRQLAAEPAPGAGPTRRRTRSPVTAAPVPALAPVPAPLSAPVAAASDSPLVADAVAALRRLGLSAADAQQRVGAAWQQLGGRVAAAGELVALALKQPAP